MHRKEKARMPLVLLLLLFISSIPCPKVTQTSLVEFTSRRPQQGTVTVGQDTYAFSRDRNLYTLTYPDRSQYIVEKRIGSDIYTTYDEAGNNIAFDRPWGAYTSPFSLVMDIRTYLEGEKYDRIRVIESVITLLETVFGLCALLAPKFTWWLETGRKTPGAQPDPAVLKWNRIVGGAIVLLSIFFLYGTWRP